MVFVKECLQRQGDQYCPIEDQKEENRFLSDYGLKINLPLTKKNKLKKISKEMFTWDSSKISNQISIYRQKVEEGSAVLVSIPKRVVKSAVRRNEIRRKTKEIFRKNKSLSDGYNFLVKFKADCDPKVEEFLSYLKNG
tara:strand:+ start:26 stop:439 length:414 start_codon:yes stop_codon:yes gene_type:complete